MIDQLHLSSQEMHLQGGRSSWLDISATNTTRAFSYKKKTSQAWPIKSPYKHWGQLLIHSNWTLFRRGARGAQICNYPSLPNFSQTFVLTVDRKICISAVSVSRFVICVITTFPLPWYILTLFSNKVQPTAQEPLHQSPDMTSPESRTICEGEEVGINFQIAPLHRILSGPRYTWTLDTIC